MQGTVHGSMFILQSKKKLAQHQHLKKKKTTPQNLVNILPETQSWTSVEGWKCPNNISDLEIAPKQIKEAPASMLQNHLRDNFFKA